MKSFPLTALSPASVQIVNGRRATAESMNIEGAETAEINDSNRQSNMR
jgi:hypothetical protein